MSPQLCNVAIALEKKKKKKKKKGKLKNLLSYKFNK
jgi:hypothetical protein